VKELRLAGAIVVTLSANALGQTISPMPAVASHQTFTMTSHQKLVTDYCVGCHNERTKSGGLVLSTLVSTLESGKVAEGAREWERVILKLKAGMMPPPTARKPAPDALAALITTLETELDRAAASNPNPGRPSLHRLNRTEYANSIRDLLALDVDAESLLPADDMSHGFDNMSEVLTVSPTLMDAYVRAAGKIARAAVGDPGVSPLVETYQLPAGLSQLHHVEGAPFGTRGGIAVRHHFPADGEYVFLMTLYFSTGGPLMGSQQRDQQIEIAVNGERQALIDVNPRMQQMDIIQTVPLKVKAGPQMISAAFINKAYGPIQDTVMPFDFALVNTAIGTVSGLTGLPHLRDLGIKGPYNVTGLGDTPSRRKVLVCRPATAAEEEPCARTIIANLARQGFRRPVTAADQKLLLAQYRKGRGQGNFEAGIRTVVQAVVSDPEFVFRFEQTPANAAAGSNIRVSDIELASRLSYFLWSSAPDEQLLGVATKGRLKDPAVLEREVRRMIADRRSESLSTNFAGQWLHLRNLEEFSPEAYLFPNVDINLLKSMRRETELLFDSIVREDRKVVDMLGADYTFVNERLARHYQMQNIEGSQFRRVTVTDEVRKGLLGHASVLAVTSFPTRTAPTLRGKWVLDNLLDAPPPNPPANVPALTENKEDAKRLPVRERLEQHRANPACAACHRMMDPIGMALENFDAVGAWRIRDEGAPVVPTGELVDGTQLDGPVGLRRALEARSDAFVSTLTKKLLTYALGRGIDYSDMPVVRSILRDAAREDDRFSAIVMAIVKSAPFQMRRVEEAESTNAAARIASEPPSRQH
jgi:hypothetical protein